MEPTKTFRLNYDNNHVQGMVNGLEAVKQAVFLMLSVPRFDHLIFSAEYGHELESLVGKEMDYVLGDIKRIVQEALMIDDRIIAVENLTLVQEEESARVSFQVVTIYGEFEHEMEVQAIGIS